MTDKTLQFNLPKIVNTSFTRGYSRLSFDTLLFEYIGEYLCTSKYSLNRLYYWTGIMAGPLFENS